MLHQLTLLIVNKMIDYINLIIARLNYIKVGGELQYIPITCQAEFMVILSNTHLFAFRMNFTV